MKAGKKKLLQSNSNAIAGISSSLRMKQEVKQLEESALKNELVIIIGTGVSLALTEGKVPQLSWKGLVADGLIYSEIKGLITSSQKASWMGHLDSLDIDELLGAAEFVSRKLGAPSGDLYARWLEKNFKDIKPTNQAMIEAVSAIHHSGIPICTLNYDHLLEDVTQLPSITLNDTPKLASWMRRESDGVLHLHGSWIAPISCVLGIRDYEITLGSDLRDLVQRSLGAFKRLLFVGCGETFSDPNFTALIKWLREIMGASSLQHYALVTNDEVASRNADPAWHGFVEPIGYGNRREDLPQFIKQHFDSISKDSNFVAKSSPDKGDRNSELIQRYLAFLVKDCGHMTIEGVRADMDISRQRFDLERLFVPLKILECPPDFLSNDPLAEQKIREWQEKNKKPSAFGKVFTHHKRLALLALPGGGKTLLLKRLAVAYADPARLTATADLLPKLDLIPILIRCREWKEHIRKPILTLLQNLSDITGQSNLIGLKDAVLPSLVKGGVLLLVDGLDEIHDDADRATFVEHLESFLDDYPHVRLIVTSREAGFGLVAPCLSRFCQKWRVAPLENDAIKLLCNHWRRLMSGDAPESVTEMNEVAEHLVWNSSLHKLAENPLLLTMLLVVKHGAGRLPPDRVSLYSRAVEVLLDTWNIKGHAALNLKEAIPQLAFVAFQLMKQGKQTATEKELLRLIEKSRDQVAHIRRYAKDSPYEFLKRVELRSSLLLEAGHQMENGQTVPFYQFRHLTFQEYLAAVAVAEGHYVGYSTEDTILTSIQDLIVAEEWKEVVPMAAVLARKQAEPLMIELVNRAEAVPIDKLEGERHGHSENFLLGKNLPIPVLRLAQCLVEEADASPETITRSLKVIAKACCYHDSGMEMRSLGRGPYGPELLHHAWYLYSKMGPKCEGYRRSCLQVAAGGWSGRLAEGEEINPELLQLLNSDDEEEIGRGLFVIAGRIFVNVERVAGMSSDRGRLPSQLIELVQHFFTGQTTAINVAALWAWAITMYHSEILGHPSPEGLDLILKIWLQDDCNFMIREAAATALWTQFGLERKLWAPKLEAADIEKIKQFFKQKKSQSEEYTQGACLIVAFHSRSVWTDEELAIKLRIIKKTGNVGARQPGRLDIMISQLDLKKVLISTRRSRKSKGNSK